MPQRNENIERVIRAMRERVDDSLSLDAMAAIAVQSPYHFIRSFHRTTGVPPRQFLAALRLEAAKRLLLTTKCSVTDACFDVGYSSLGTFITRFKQLVGTPPRHLRRLASMTRAHAEVATAAQSRPPAARQPGATLSGRVAAPEEFRGFIFVGVFTSTIPQGLPLSCALLTAAGPYSVGGLRDGTYYVMAAALPASGDPLTYLLSDAQLRGRAGPVTVRDGGAAGDTDVELRPPDVTDPPILVALPVLVQKRLAAAARAHDRRCAHDPGYRRRDDLCRRSGGVVRVVPRRARDRDHPQ